MGDSLRYLLHLYRHLVQIGCRVPQIARLMTVDSILGLPPSAFAVPIRSGLCS